MATSKSLRVPVRDYPVRGNDEVVMLDVRHIRRDGGTQVRLSLDRALVIEYAELMLSGADFPPVSVRFDGISHWLTDGFHRVAAAESVGRPHIRARVSPGTLQDARWESYSANGTNGLRRSKADIEAMLRQALVHPLALRLSSRQIAGHLHVPESTLRRWRIKLSAPDGADTVRAAVRSGRTYSIETANIGRTRARFISASKQLERLRADFEHMKHLASAEAQVLLSAFGHWIFAQQPATVCLDRIEEVIHRLSPSPLSTPEFVGRPDIT